MSTSGKKPTLEKTPNTDPEEDLDDLDGEPIPKDSNVLSQFGPGQVGNSLTSPPPPPPTATTKTAFTRPRNNTRVDAPPTSVPGSGSAVFDPLVEGDEDALSTDFARELALGMENLMREITGDPSTSKIAEGAAAEMSEEERAKAFKAAWDAMLVESADANQGDAGVSDQGKEKAPPAGAFQDKIKQAMDKLKDSESKFQGPSGSGGPTGADSLETLLQSLGDIGLGGEGSGDEEKEFAGFLETMMTQLMSKDVLYDPLKELSDSFPSYLEKPPAPISEENMKLYKSQQACVKKILAVFDKSDYNDENPEYNKQIVELMSEMQTYGSPPVEIMGDLPPGFDGKGVPGMGEDGCVVL